MLRTTLTQGTDPNTKMEYKSNQTINLANCADVTHYFNTGDRP